MQKCIQIFEEMTKKQEIGNKDLSYISIFSSRKDKKISWMFKDEVEEKHKREKLLKEETPRGANQRQRQTEWRTRI